MAAPKVPHIIECGDCSLLLISPSNSWFVEEVFRYEDVKKYFVLRVEHAENIRAFCEYLVNAIQEGTSLSYIMFNNYGQEVGLITAELVANNATNSPVWNVGYAVHPSHRRKGYASAALKGLTDFLLQNFSFQYVMVDISIDNVASELVAKRCGFTKPNDFTGYYDMDHQEVGLRFKWYKQLDGGRTSYFNQACQCYREERYVEALEGFKRALNEPYTPGTPYTDAQIYSNLGMVLSSLYMYSQAFHALKKAQSLGLNNPSIEKEVLWLRRNVGLY